MRSAELHGWTRHTLEWRAIADEIKADILANGVDSRGVLTQRYGSDALDAWLLLAVLTRFLPPDDPRSRATVLAFADELTEEGRVLRLPSFASPLHLYAEEIEPRTGRHRAISRRRSPTWR